MFISAFENRQAGRSPRRRRDWEGWIRRGSLIVMSLLCGATPAAAVWPTDPLVNVPVCTAAELQGRHAMVSDGSGGAITVWNDARDGSPLTLHAQRVNASGTIQWDLDGIPGATLTSGAFVDLVACRDGAGGIIFAWADTRFGNQDIFAQRINFQGTLMWGADGVQVTSDAAAQYAPMIVYPGSGGALIAWKDDSTNPTSIMCQRLNSTGAPQYFGGDVLLAAQPLVPSEPRLVDDQAGGAILVYASDSGQGDADIVATRINWSGALAYSASPVATGPLEQTDPVAVSDQAGGAFVAWVRDGGRVEKINSAGNRVWGAGQGVRVSTFDDLGGVALISDQIGGAFVAFDVIRNTAETDLFCQRVNGAGTALWDERGALLCGAAFDQRVTAGIPGPNGSAIIAWEDERGGVDIDIYAQRLDPNGNPVWTGGGDAVSTAPGDQTEIKIVSDEIWGANLSWRDTRNAPTLDDVYIQNTPLGPSLVGVDGPGAAEISLRSPNPIRGAAQVEFSLSEPGPAELTVYDAQGRRVEDLVAGSLGAGSHVVTWAGRAGDGRYVASGSYFLRLQTPSASLNRRVVLVR